MFVQTWLNRVPVAAGAGFGVNSVVVSLSLKMKDGTGGVFFPHGLAREGFKLYSTPNMSEF